MAIKITKIGDKEKLISDKTKKEKFKNILWEDLKSSDKDEILRTLAERAGLIEVE